MAKPSISVVIPVYNQERYIEETLQSVLIQEGVNFEIIVVNDGSTDSSAEILRNYWKRIILVEQKNRGVAEARNAGVWAAGAELIAFLDGDDRYLPGHLARTLQLAEQHPQTILFYGDAELIDENGEKLSIQRCNPKPELKKLILANFIIASSVIARKKLFDQGQWFESFHPSEDWDLWLRAIELGQFIHYPWIGTQYRKHQQGAIKSKKILAEEMALKVLDRVWERHPDAGGTLKNTALANAYYESLIRFLAAGDGEEARKRALLCLGKNPLMIKAWTAFAFSLLPDSIVKTVVNARKEIRKWLA